MSHAWDAQTNLQGASSTWQSRVRNKTGNWAGIRDWRSLNDMLTFGFYSKQNEDQLCILDQQNSGNVATLPEHKSEGKCLTAKGLFGKLLSANEVMGSRNRECILRNLKWMPTLPKADAVVKGLKLCLLLSAMGFPILSLFNPPKYNR